MVDVTTSLLPRESSRLDTKELLTFMAETFTDWMIRMMAGEENVRKAVITFQSDDGIISQIWSPEETPSKADQIGLLRFAQLAVENDLVNSWNSSD